MQWHRFIAEPKIAPADRAACELQVACGTCEYDGSHEKNEDSSVVSFRGFALAVAAAPSTPTRGAS
eukprot:7268055-Pyramimonas_sp.AAC.1